MARPVVSTRLGVEGLDFVEGKEIVLADDPPAFAEAVAGLLGDATLRRQLGGAARRRVAAAYSPSVLRRQVSRALARVAAPPDRAGREASPPLMQMSR